MTECPRCGDPILWVHTTLGGVLPVDENPVADGNVLFTGRRVRNRQGITRPEVRVEDTFTLFDDGVARHAVHPCRLPPHPGHS